MDIHQVVDDPALDVPFMLVHHYFLTCVQIDKRKNRRQFQTQIRMNYIVTGTKYKVGTATVQLQIKDSFTFHL